MKITLLLTFTALVVSGVTLALVAWSFNPDQEFRWG
jgi:hypothetical protein